MTPLPRTTSSPEQTHTHSHTHTHTHTHTQTHTHTHTQTHTHRHTRILRPKVQISLTARHPKCLRSDLCSTSAGLETDVGFCQEKINKTDILVYRLTLKSSGTIWSLLS